MAETLAEAMREIAEELLERNERGVSPLELAHAVEVRFPELFDAKANELARRALVNQARLLLRPTPAEQQQLDGFGDLPKTFTVPDAEGDVRYILLKHATLGDEAADLEVKRLNLVACGAEYRKARRRHNTLWSAPGAHDAMLVTRAAELAS